MSLGFEAALNRARENERIAGQMLHEEMVKVEGRDDGRIESLQRAWNRAFDAMRKAENDAIGILTASKELVRWSDIEGALSESIQVLHQSLRALVVRVCTLVSLPPEQYQKLNATFQAQLDKVFEELNAGDYREAWIGREDLELAGE